MSTRRLPPSRRPERQRSESVRDLWKSFERDVVPKDATHIQRQEMRRSFYAGAWGMLNLMTAIGDDSVSEAEGVRTIESLRHECETFVKLMNAGGG